VLDRKVCHIVQGGFGGAGIVPGSSGVHEASMAALALGGMLPQAAALGGRSASNGAREGRIAIGERAAGSVRERGIKDHDRDIGIRLAKRVPRCADAGRRRGDLRTQLHGTPDAFVPPRQLGE